MCELLGAALDAAVARVLDVQGLVTRPNGQPAYEIEWDPEARCNEDDMGAWKMWRWFTPSTDGQLAMALQTQHDIAVYPDADAAAAGTEKWVAGFDLRFEGDDGYSSDAGTYWPGDRALTVDHAARGTTPAIAICRALVARHEAQAAAAVKEAADQAARNERARLQTIFDNAHVRAWAMIYQRVPTTVFETDEDRQAYNALLDAHRDPESVKTLPAWLQRFFGPPGGVEQGATPGTIVPIGPVSRLSIKGDDTL